MVARVMQVVIIGGGPSGGRPAALTLLKAQVPVTIIEREPFPRYRPGETLHPGIEPLLARLGVADQSRSAAGLCEAFWVCGRGGMVRCTLSPYGDDANGPW